MKSEINSCPTTRLGRFLAAVIAVPLLGLLVGGCVNVREGGVLAEPFPTEAPSFLSGPMAIMLTNADGFQGHVVMESRSASSGMNGFSGELMGRGTKLLFISEGNNPSGKRSRAYGFSFIWDVAANSGYLLSEALQGYAPVASGVRFTNVVVQRAMGNGTPEKIDGHPCEQAQAVVSSSDGAQMMLQVWQATDMGGFPARIMSVTNAGSFSLNFTRLRRDAPPPEAFLIPDGFTKYTNSKVMVTELMAREQVYRRAHANRYGDFEHDGDQRDLHRGRY